MHALLINLAGRVRGLNRSAAVANSIPEEIRARLLASLFERRDSIVNAGIAGILVSGIVAFSAPAAWAAWWLAAHTILFLARLVHIARFNARAAPDPIAEAPRFAVGGFLSALLWGLLGGLSLWLLDDALLQAAVVITASGVAGGTASRNAGYPALAKMQVAATLILTAAGGAGRAEPLYLFIAMLCLLHVYSLVSLVTRLHADELALLLTSRERAAMAEALACQNERFEAALDNMSHGLCMFDAAHRVVVHNRRYVELCGDGESNVAPGTPLRDLFANNDRASEPDEAFSALEATLAARGRAEFEHVVAGRTLSITYSPMSSGGMVAVYADVTDRRQAEERLAYLARHDSLTGLPNRSQFAEVIKRAFSADVGGEAATAVLCLDLDRFKSINDTLGHPVGDALLCAVAGRLRATVGAEGLVARFGGDEFAVLVERTSLATATALAERIVRALSEPYVFDEQQALIGASVGIAIASVDGMDPETLIKHADLALYRAKSDGKGIWRLFELEMDTEAQARRRLEIELRSALIDGSFELHFQPCINLASGRTATCEALLRWRHPSKGLIEPDAFIGLAEEVGLIVPIGDWVLRQACAEAMRWPESMRVAVNVSAVQFRARTVVPGVVSALASSGLAPHRLELEITETALVEDEAGTLKALAQIRSFGVRVAMDDFGTGYSSLSYLRSFPFDRIKIDGSFVGDLSDNAECAAIVRAVNGLGASLGIAVTAEGVETVEQLDFVRAEGCTEAQGYLMSLPLNVAALRRYLANEGARLSNAA